MIVNVGHMLPRLAPTEHPTTLDIAWAAGIIEGEGHINSSRVVVRQCDRWILDRLRALFGGVVRCVKQSEVRSLQNPKTGKIYHANQQHEWAVSGARARGLMMTCYRFFSPHRKAQVESGLDLAEAWKWHKMLDEKAKRDTVIR